MDFVENIHFKILINHTSFHMLVLKLFHL